MKKNLKILLGIVILVLLIKFLTTVFIEHWVGEKIQETFTEKNSNYKVEIKKVHISMISPGIELEGISIYSKQDHQGSRDLIGEISSINVKGISLTKAIFKHNINISEITISNSSINGKIPFSHKVISPMVSPLNITIGDIFFDNIDLALTNTSNTRSYSVKEGVLKLHDFEVKKRDTLSPGIVRQIDFAAKELFSVTADSMYTYKAIGINYKSNSNTLTVERLSVHPDYKNHNFTSRSEYQMDRIEAGCNSIFVHGFSAADYLKSGSLVSSYIEIGKMDLNVFRDKRKKFRHVKKPVFQDMIYNYPGLIRIDSIGILSGDITYTEHVEKANEPGTITFEKIVAKIYKITNDTIYRTEKGYLELKADALLMGKGKFAILLKGRIFDRDNTFSVNGTLSGMEANELNPMLEKNAFVYVTSGKIDAVDFGFTANNTKATGKMTLSYHGLNIAVKNKRTDDTTAFFTKLVSVIANIKVLDSNPIPGDAIRVGSIDYERDPERFLFNYCCKSILTGVKSSITKKPQRKKK
jgi:hypothetical protein